MSLIPSMFLLTLKRRLMLIFLVLKSVIGHEYFHNWTGNRVTCRDWFQLSLKEGLTVFRDQEFSADLNSAAVKGLMMSGFCVSFSSLKMRVLWPIPSGHHLMWK